MALEDPYLPGGGGAGGRGRGVVVGKEGGVRLEPETYLGMHFHEVRHTDTVRGKGGGGGGGGDVRG